MNVDRRFVGRRFEYPMMFQTASLNEVARRLPVMFSKPHGVSVNSTMQFQGLIVADEDCDWDFFVSYTQADRSWAEWIAWILEENGYRVLVQAWDFVPGTNWTQHMHDGTARAARTIAVLSDDYLKSVYGKPEWLAAWQQDPDGAQRKLIPIRVADCDRPGLPVKEFPH